MWFQAGRYPAHHFRAGPDGRPAHTLGRGILQYDLPVIFQYGCTGTTDPFDINQGRAGEPPGKRDDLRLLGHLENFPDKRFGRFCHTGGKGIPLGGDLTFTFHGG